MEGRIMVVALIEHGVVKQVWRDVETKSEFTKKYKLSGAKYIALPKGVVAGQIEDGRGGFKNLEPLPRSTEPADYTHTRRQFRDLLTATQETEIEGAIKAVTKPRIKRALRNWWNNETLYEWDDREMVKVLTLVAPETATAIEAAWIA